MCDHCSCRQFGPIADLTAEHEVILELAWQLAENHDERSPERLAVRDELLVLLDRHVLKEEAGLYPELLLSGDLPATDCDELEDEHVTVHAALVAAKFDRRDFYALAAHVEQEEMELFPAAMFAFDDDVWDRLTDLQVRTAPVPVP